MNGAQYFDGTDGLNVPAHPDFDWGIGDSFSIESWVKVDPHNPPQNEMLIGRDGGASSSLHWWIGLGDPLGVATFVCIATDGSGYSGGADVLVGTTDLRDGLWHHVVVIREAGGTNRLYVDSGLEAEKTVNYTAGFEGSTPLTIGWFNLSGNYEMQGNIDELAVYSRALDFVEIQQHYNDGLAGQGYCDESAYTLITSVAPTTGTVGLPYTYDAEATGNPAPTFALSEAPEGMVIDPASGVITFTPIVEGDFPVTVEAGRIDDAHTPWMFERDVS